MPVKPQFGLKWETTGLFQGEMGRFPIITAIKFPILGRICKSFCINTLRRHVVDIIVVLRPTPLGKILSHRRGFDLGVRGERAAAKKESVKSREGEEEGGKRKRRRGERGRDMHTDRG
jgi:hypothetical protein